jgi:hypothetical protein
MEIQAQQNQTLQSDAKVVVADSAGLAANAGQRQTPSQFRNPAHGWQTSFARFQCALH